MQNSITSTTGTIRKKDPTITYSFDVGNLYSFNVLIDYLLSSYVLHKHNIQSKKASIIIAQIIDAGHFSKRTVYLSTTQSLFLKYKLKLTNYLNYYTYQPSLLDLKNILTQKNTTSLE
jgi:hypothetical protein